ncbi:protein FAR1-RELATED SEQUENCE 5-like [Arachis ipaensis]|uniref:protein FAR1-RELATED SEQUENCE 5-like n=1 Tax=Arachis ipaensis TaxID=130454 RepID=UPI0007AFC552|nr:protein FAR1-RELATED SEQUENCE 5-like [Arachis ipaensis]XP_025664387.1 protein FAR1-RELATED SEQUENCE 5-like [Arachis hypogaea]
MADYQLFGDVLAFDATYRSNKYKKPLVVFSGSNHHKKTAIFRFSLLEDEEVRAYRWVLLNMLDVMENKKPSVVVTDGDKAMRAAIADVLPSARHRLCGWHLEKNCVLRVKEPEFWKVFKKAIYANFDVAKTTSRCEGINAFVKGFLKSTNSLLELVQILDRVVKDYRNNEVTAQFYSSYYTPVLTTGLDKIELFAAKLYTRAIFKEVRKQIKGVGSLLFLGKTALARRPSTSSQASGTVVSEGIPCCHIFCVMKYEGWDEIPPGLILRRWCKDAKEWTANATCNSSGHNSHLLRYGALCSAISVVAKLASDDAADFFLARDALTSLARRL